MHVQVLASGSAGNSTLVRAGELGVLVDAGLGPRAMRERFEAVGLGPRAVDHVLVSHAHLDHARSVGVVAKRQDATVHCPEAAMRFASVSRAPRIAALPVGGELELACAGGPPLRVRTVRVPHDCDPTVAFRLEHGGRVLVHLTDVGAPRDDLARALGGAHLLVLEANHDARMLAEGPYPEALQRRVRGDGGHLSNDQMAVLLARLAGPELHTVVLAHLSTKNNTPELAAAAARAALASRGRADVRVLCARQDEPTENLRV